ncbi:hypothetical protein [Vibrio ezurae]|uniref:Uncharacterized protein n=1 Tax=Vibrio ezurae NBRC 102218 TaxID=1219080 RepID=U3AHX5_9VIBR|nr:hypothetical protein [Vibrio ezurae]GAD79531.1 hypothetical protein VEZ01S_17_00180 [Vibrio ezurae NBRC 102218]
MYEILIHSAYKHNELVELLNAELGDNLDGVIFCWAQTTSLFIEALNDITIEEAITVIQELLGDVKIELDPEDDEDEYME